MTNMSQKSVELKRIRRTRYKRACRPIMQKFGCTAMQVAGVVESVFRENTRLKVDLRDAQRGWEDTQKAYAVLFEQDKTRTMEIESLRTQLKLLEEQANAREQPTTE